MSSELNRRDLLKFFSATAFATPLALTAAEPGKPLFFTADEFTLLDTLTELIIPQDSHSPGAHAAGVAAYIDRSVAEAFLPEEKTSWRKGLAAVNALSQSTNQKTFTALNKQQQASVLRKLAGSGYEGKTEGQEHKSEAEKFYGQLKNTAIDAYYTSKIGIHDEMHYKGNCILQEYVGYMPDDPLPPISSLAALS